MLYLYNKNVFWGEGWKREKKWWMKSKVILGIEERGKVETRERQYDWLHFPVMGTLLFLTMYLDTFSIERWSLCSLFFIMEKLVTTLEMVLCDFWNYIRWFSFCPVFLWCSLLEPTPMMWDAQAARRKSCWSSIWGLHCYQWSSHQTWRGVSIWMSWALAMESPQLRSWCEEVSLTYPSRIPNWSTASASMVIVLYHLVSFHAAMVAKQLAWRRRSENNES